MPLASRPYHLYSTTKVRGSTIIANVGMTAVISPGQREKPSYSLGRQATSTQRTAAEMKNRVILLLNLHRMRAALRMATASILIRPNRHSSSSLSAAIKALVASRPIPSTSFIHSHLLVGRGVGSSRLPLPTAHVNPR